MRRALTLRCRLGTAWGGAPAPGGKTSYGPFSATAKARHEREQREREHQQQAVPWSPAASVDVMQNIQLGTNLHLRLSLATLTHPSQLKKMAYQSPEWKRAMTQLYRAILRLHNKVVAVSVERSRTAGAAEAVASVTGVHSGSESGTSSVRVAVRSASTSISQSLPGEDSSPKSAEAPADPIGVDDCMLRHLLSPQQREFGNRFVQREFRQHMDADAVYAAIFYESWYQYVLQLASGVTAREMTEEERRLLTADQKAKLAELHDAFTALKSEQESNFMI